jgi:hypothetical protein
MSKYIFTRLVIKIFYSNFLQPEIFLIFLPIYDLFSYFTGFQCFGFFVFCSGGFAITSLFKLSAAYYLSYMKSLSNKPLSLAKIKDREKSIFYEFFNSNIFKTIKVIVVTYYFIELVYRIIKTLVS